MSKEETIIREAINKIAMLPGSLEDYKCRLETCEYEIYAAMKVVNADIRLRDKNNEGA